MASKLLKTFAYTKIQKIKQAKGAWKRKEFSLLQLVISSFLVIQSTREHFRGGEADARLGCRDKIDSISL